MKYFVFVSDAKVDMLLPQIPQELKSKLAAEVGVNVGVLSAKLKSERDTGVKPRKQWLRRMLDASIWGPPSAEEEARATRGQSV